MNNFTEDLTGLSRADLVYKAKLADMEEQQRDLTFHFEAQLKIAQEAAAAGCALAGGDVELPAAVPQRGGKARAKRRSS